MPDSIAIVPFRPELGPAFTELNRATLPLEGMDVVGYTINPQVHAFDNASLTESLAAQAETPRINVARKWQTRGTGNFMKFLSGNGLWEWWSVGVLE